MDNELLKERTERVFKGVEAFSSGIDADELDQFILSEVRILANKIDSYTKEGGFTAPFIFDILSLAHLKNLEVLEQLLEDNKKYDYDRSAKIVAINQVNYKLHDIANEAYEKIISYDTIRR